MRVRWDAMSTVTNNSTTPAPLLWDSRGRLTAGTTCPGGNGGRKNCIASLDSDSLAILGSWDVPEEILFNGLTYMSLKDDLIVIPGPEYGYELHRNGSEINLSRKIDFRDELPNGSILPNMAYDGLGNLWFTNGGPSSGDGGAPGSESSVTAVFGFIGPDGSNDTLKLENSVIENSIAVNNDTVYAITGPAGANDHVNATGNVYALRASPYGVEIVYNATYDAGDGIKADGVSRGCGSTSSLLGDEYVAITDNANDHVNLVIFPQAKANQPDVDISPVCKVPLFSPGESANEGAVLAHFDGTTYSVAIVNFYNIPRPFWFVDSDIPLNGNWNNVSGMGGGLTRVDITPQQDGSVKCSVRWNDEKSKDTSLPTLSTTTGLLYNYVQDWETADEEGLYVWYMVAYDWETGEEVWRYRVGAGGAYNSNLQVTALGPDGCVWIMVVGGVVKVCDG